WRIGRKEEIHLEPDQRCRKVRKPFQLPLRPARLQEDSLALDPALLAQPVPEGIKQVLARLRSHTHEDANPGHFCRRLGVRGAWHAKEAKGEHDDEPDGVAPHGNLLPSAPCRPCPWHTSGNQTSVVRLRAAER